MGNSFGVWVAMWETAGGNPNQIATCRHPAFAVPLPPVLRLAWNLNYFLHSRRRCPTAVVLGCRGLVQKRIGLLRGTGVLVLLLRPDLDGQSSYSPIDQALVFSHLSTLGSWKHSNQMELQSRKASFVFPRRWQGTLPVACCSSAALSLAWAELSLCMFSLELDTIYLTKQLLLAVVRQRWSSESSRVWWLLILS
jgi:hypothetical protein